jgi:hypothetical protein
MYVGDLRRNLRGSTGHARRADTGDGAEKTGLWAFQLGGEGDEVWVREADLSFIRSARARDRR